MSAPLLQRALIESGGENDLSNLVQALAYKYQQNLEAAKANASYDLSRASLDWVLKWQGDTLRVTFRLPEEWYYVEHGRNRTTGKTGKRWEDPVGDIMRWIDLKRIVPQPRMKSARVPATKKTIDKQEQKKQMAMAIVRKIHRRGFYTRGPMDIQVYGKHPLERATEEVEAREKLVGILRDAVGQEIRVELGEVVKSLRKKQM